MAILTGTNNNNTLNGTNQADELFGLEGDDILLGGGGADRLNGGAGSDALQGGAGVDAYVYTAISDSTPTARDVILDFATSERIDLSAVAPSRLVWAGTTPRAYGVWYTQADGNTHVWADADGDAEAEFSIQLVGTFTLTATHFIGLNTAPDIRATSGDAASRTVAETNGALVASGTLTVSDVDLADTVAIAVGSVSVTGTAGGRGTEAFLGMLRVVDAALIADPGQVNNVPWVFDSGAENFDFLASGESLTLTYTVTATDSATPLGATDAQTITVRITGTNDAPDVRVGTGDAAAASLAVSGAVLSAAGLLTVTDADLSNTVTVTVTGVVASAPTPGLSATQLRSFLTVTGGPLAADPGASGNLGWNFNSGSQAFGFVGEGQTLLLSYTVRVTDSAGAIDTAVVTITIAGSNDAPVLATATARAYTENGAPLVVNGSLTVTDVDSTTLARATVAITGGFAAGQDVLSFGNTSATTYGDIQAVYDSASGVLTLESAGGAATRGQWQAALRAVRYSNTSDDPVTTGRVVSFQIDDGGTQNSVSNVLNSTVSLTPRNDAPTVGALIGDVATASIVVSGPALAANGTLSVADPDAADTVTAEVIGVATSRAMPGLSAAQVRGLLTVTGGALAADPGSSGNLGWAFNASAGAFAFVGEGETLVLTYTIRVRDNSAATGTEVVTITITGSNDAPILANATARSYTENGAPLVVNNALTLTDVDSTTLASATVAIAGGFVPGQDLLSFTSSGSYGNIQAAYDSASGVLTLESAGGTATRAQWQAALRAVRYSNSSDDPSTATRTFNFQIDDGRSDNSLSNVLTSTLGITAVNDAPVTGPVTLDPVRVNGVRIITQAELLANASDVDGPSLTAINLTRISGLGALVGNGDGTWAYTPAAGDQSSVSFRYTVTDGSRSVTGTAAMDIVPNSAPVASGFSLSVSEDEFVSGTLPVATDADGDALTYALGRNATWGFAVVNSDGSFSYAPRANYNGPDSFSFVVTDGHGGSTTYTASLVVNPANDGPQTNVVAGVATTSIDSEGGGEFGFDVAVQQDGMILVAGQTHTAAGGTDFALVRYDSRGLLDTSFGGGDGVVTTNLGNGQNPLDSAVSVALQPDGKIVVAGHAQRGNSQYFAIARYDADGTPDVEFGDGDGNVVTLNAPGHVGGLAVQPDGKILVSGRASIGSGASGVGLVRYNSDGSLDGTFGGGDGVATTAIESNLFGGGYRLALQGDGRILVSGTYYTSGTTAVFALLRYNADGSADAGFGDGDGIVISALDGESRSRAGNDVAVQADGKILVAGYVATANGGTHIALVRYNADGNLDESFGEGSGAVTTPIGELSVGHGLAVQADGKILVSGWAETSHGSEVALVRYNVDGSLDTPFGGGDGVVTTDIGRGPNSEAGYSVVLQSDGKILVTGGAFIASSTGYDVVLARYNADGSLDSTFGGMQVPSADAGQLYSFELPIGLFSDVDGDALTLSVTRADGSAVPAWLTLSGNTLSGTPPAESVDLALRVVATDPSGASASIPFFLHVEGARENIAPVSADLSATAVEDTVLNGMLPAATDADGDAVSYALEASAAHGVAVVNADGSFRYTPAENYNGPDAFTFVVTDGNGGSNKYTVNLVMTPVNDQASIGGVASGTVAEDGTLTAGGVLTVTDVDAGEAAVVAQTNVAGTYGVFSVTGDGVWTYQLANAAANVQSLAQGQSVSDLFTVTSADGTAAQISVTVTGSNDAPTAADFAASTSKDTLLEGTLPAAQDVDRDAVTYALAAQSSHGAAVVDADGSYSYTPTAGYSGADAFSYSVSDGNGGSNTYTVEVSVITENHAPVLAGAAFVMDAGDGIVTTDMGGTDYGYSVAVQPDGKILVAGDAHTAASGYDFALVRYHADGTRDTSFGGGDGIVTANLGNIDHGYSVAVQPDGRIVLAGSSHNGSSLEFALLRYHADGTLDTSFGGGDGIVTTDVGGIDFGYSVAVQPDGRIVLAGYSIGSNTGIALVRYQADGSLDTGFGGGDGIVTTPVGGNTDVRYSVAVQPDGRIVVAGSASNGSNFDVALVRYHADGTLDTSFGGGIVTTPVGAGHDYGYSLALQPDGRIVVAGYSIASGNYDFTLVRYHADGSLDTGFGGGDGIVTTNLGSIDQGFSVALQPDGRIVVSGRSNAGIALLRYTADGELDSSFGGGDGIVTTPVGTNNDIGYSVALQPDGRIVVAGHSTIGSNQDFMLVRYNADGTLDTSFDGLNVVNEGAPFSFTLPEGRFVDQDGDALAFTATLADGFALPAWLSFDAAALTFSGTAPTGAPDLALRVTATDPGGLSVSEIIVLHTASPPNSAPVAAGASLEIAEDTPLNGTLPVATDADGDAVSYALGSGAAHGVALVNGDGSFSYTAEGNYYGADAFAFVVSDGSGGSNTYTVSISVAPVNDPAHIRTSKLSSASEDDGILVDGEFDVIDVDEGEAGIAPQQNVSGVYGVFNVAESGAWTYELNNAAANVQSLAQGQSVFEAFEVFSIDGTASQQISIRIFGANDAPALASEHSVATADGASVGGTASASDVDAGAVLTYEVTQGNHGAVAIDAASGAWTYAPATGFSGGDSFLITVSDEWGASTQQTVAVTVFDTNQSPLAAAASVSVLEDVLLDGTLPVATDADGDAVSYALAAPAAHGIAAVNADGSFTYTPSANYHGADAFTYSISDGRSGTNTYTVSVTVDPVNDTAAIAGATTGSVTEDGATSANGALTVTDVDEGEAAIVARTAIAGAFGSFSVTAAGSWSYQLDNAATNVQALAQGQPVTDVFTVSSLDGTATQHVTITVNGANDAPTIAASASVTTPEEASATGVSSGADVDGGAVLSYAAADGLHGLVAIDASTGAWTYAPAADFAGNDSFVVTVRDQLGAEAQQTVTVAVENVNDAPVAASAAIEATEDTVFNGTLPPATDVDGDVLTYALGAAAAQGSVVVNADGSFSYAPAANYNGPDSFTYVVSDGHGSSNVYTVGVNVAAVNDSASISGVASGLVTEDGVTSAVGALSVTDQDAGETSIVPRSNVAGSYGLFSITAVGAWTYVLDNAAASVQSLARGPTVSDSFLVTSQDGTASQQVTLTITGTNDAPAIAASVSVSTLEEVAVGGTAAGTDADNGAVLTYAVGIATHGTVAIDAESGVWSYAPTLDYAGSDSFIVTVADEWGASAQQTVSVSVASVNDAPVAAATSLTVAEDGAYASTLPAASDVDGDTITYTLGADATHGAAIVNSDGSFSYTPVADYNGNDSFTYTVSDGLGGSSSYSVLIAVTPLNDAPVAANASVTTPEDALLERALPAALDADGDAVTYGLASPAAHGAVAVNPDGSYAYQPASNYFGGDSFGYTVSDGHGGTNSYVVTIDVDSVNDAPTASDLSIDTLEYTPKAGSLPVASDIENDAVVYSLAGNAAHGTVQVNPDGTYTYSPAFRYHGSDAFKYSVSDGQGGVSTYTASVWVESVNFAPTVETYAGTPGINLPVIRAGGFTVDERAHDAVLLPDGRFVVAGLVRPSGGAGDVEVALLRFNADGTRDTSFGNLEGMSLTNPGVLLTTVTPTALIVQPDGKFIVGGGPFSSFGMMRFNADGTLDTAFGGGDGIVTTQFGGTSSGTTTDALLLPDGRILLSGSGGVSTTDFLLARYDSEGNLDDSFGGGDGFVVAPTGSGGDRSAQVLLLPDGGYLQVGFKVNSGFEIVRYNADGGLDNTFGAGTGIVITSTVIGIGAEATGAALLPDGRFVVAGSTGSNGIGVVRYNANGTLDLSFGGGDGIVTATAPVGGGSLNLGPVAIQADGKILVAGQWNNATKEFLVARFTAEGTLDNSFGGDGFATFNLSQSNDWEQPHAMQLLPDGRILLVGYITESSGSTSFALLRLNADGSLDQTFRAEERVELTERSEFTYTVPADRFADRDEDPLTLSVVQRDGSAAPSWLTLDSTTRTLSGTPPLGEPDLALRIVATDPDGLSAAYDLWLHTNSPPVRTGVVITDMSRNDAPDAGRSVAILPDGRILAAGMDSSSSGGNFALARYLSDGALDRSFGDSGILITAVGAAIDTELAESIALQPDGRILVVGHGASANGSDIILVRYNADGSLDPTFGGGDGIVTATLVASTQPDQALRVRVTSDGRILVAGYAAGSSSDFALLRFNADGSPDLTFSDATPDDGIANGDGIATTSLGTVDQALDMAVQTDGRIVLAGAATQAGTGRDAALVRYNPDGTLDTTFGGGDGIVIRAVGAGSAADQANALIIQSDGKLLVAGQAAMAGTTGIDTLVMRYNADGTPDLDFGGDGVITLPVGSANQTDIAHAAALQPDGRIVVAGASGNDLFALRLNPDGSLDGTFGTGGIVRMAPGSSANVAYDVQIEPDGQILITGQAGGEHLTLIRLNNDGSRDLDFGGFNLRKFNTGAVMSFNIVQEVDSLFQDLDGDDLTYSISQADGSQLPSWLTFNSSGSLVGTPPVGAQDMPLLLIVTDAWGAAAQFEFTLEFNSDPVDIQWNAVAPSSGTAVPASGTTIANLAATDPDGDIITGFTSGGGSNGPFTVTAGAVSVTGVINPLATHVRNVVVTDQYGDQYTESFHIFTGTSGNDTALPAGGEATADLAGDDIFYALAGNDTVFGGAGDDTLFGQDGDDILHGGAGNDALYGGAGNDSHVFGDGSGADRIVGFTAGAGGGDVIDLSGVTNPDWISFDDLQQHAAQIGADTVIDLGNSNSIRLVGVSVGNLAADDFLL